MRRFVSAKARKFRLKLLFQELDLSPGSFFVGRSPSCNLTLEDPLVSRHHARIIVMETEAHIEDLGSRNGTSLNGAELVSRQKLENGDRIRIGAHDLVFVQESDLPQKAQRPTGIMVFCKGCGVALSAGVTRCPHCRAAMDTERACRQCGLPASPGASRCSGCGADLEASPQPGRAAPSRNTGTWKARMVVDVLEKALNLERFDQAVSIFQNKKEQLDDLVHFQGSDTSLLKRLSRINAELAAQTKDASLLSWVIERWSQAPVQMPREIFDALKTSAQGWYDLSGNWDRYFGKLDADDTGHT